MNIPYSYFIYTEDVDGLHIYSAAPDPILPNNLDAQSHEQVALSEKLGDSRKDTFVHIVADHFGFLIRKKVDTLDVGRFQETEESHGAA